MAQLHEDGDEVSCIVFRKHEAQDAGRESGSDHRSKQSWGVQTKSMVKPNDGLHKNRR